MITFFCLNRNEASNFVPLQSAQTAAAVYDIDWYRRDVREQKKILYIILRSQKDEAIRISGIVPQLSLPHYMKVHASCLLFCLLCTFLNYCVILQLVITLSRIAVFIHVCIILQCTAYYDTKVVISLNFMQKNILR